VLVGLDNLVERFYCILQGLFELDQCGSDIIRSNTIMMTDLRLAMFETRFSSISAYIFRFWRIKPLHHISMPCTSCFDRRFGTPESIAAYRRKQARQVRAKVRTVLVPVSHSRS